MYVSYFSNWERKTPQSDDGTFQDIREALFSCVVPFNGGNNDEDKKRTPAFSPTEYLPGTTRGKDNVVSVSMSVLDYDALTSEQVVKVLEALQGFEHIIYSTYNHAHKSRLRVACETEAASLGIDTREMPLKDLFRILGRDKNGVAQTEPKRVGPPVEVVHSGCYSFRVVIPLSQPVPGSEWLGFWLRFQSRLPVPSDPSCKDPSRIYGLPYAPSSDVSAAFFEYSAGEPVPVDTVLALELPVEFRTATGTPRMQLVSDSIAPKLIRAHGRSLQRKKFAEDVQLGSWIVAIADGIPWSREQGQRHQAMLRTTRELERKFPLTSIEALTAAWERSVTAIAGEDPTWEPQARLEDVRNAYAGARKKRLEALAKRQAEEAEAKARAIALARGDGKNEPYSPMEYGLLREFAGLRPGADLTKYWVRTLGKTNYVLTLAGYVGPYTRDDLMQVCRDKLAPAGIETTQLNDKGNETVIPIANFLQTYSTPIQAIVADMTTPNGAGFVDEDNVMHEAVCRMRDIEPEFDPLVDEYLMMVGGKHAEKLKDWLATFPELKRQTCALYLKGIKGTGKTLIPQMLAGMFFSRPAATELDRILDNFNEDLTKCPIVFADEEAKGGMRDLSSADLRKLIGSDKRSLSRKFIANATIVGAIRLILSANNNTMLRFEREELTAEDLDAVDERFLCIHMGEEIVKWIEAHGGRALTDSWVAGAFERHVMWLHKNRQVERGMRWLVAGEASDAQSITAISPAINSAVCQWVAGYLSNPKPVDSSSPGSVQFDDKGMWVNTTAIVQTWDSYVQYCKVLPTSDNVAKALRALSTGKMERIVPHGLKRRKARFHRVRLDLICQWAEIADFGDMDMFRSVEQDPESFVRQHAN